MTRFRFACVTGCIKCCDRESYVYLTGADRDRAAAFLGLAPAEFEAKYVYRTKRQLRLRKPRGAECHFLNGAGCAIHEAKPTLCRLFPFWPELIGSRRARANTAAWCPGIGRGPLIQIEAVKRMAGEMRAAYPWDYE